MITPFAKSALFLAALVVLAGCGDATTNERPAAPDTTGTAARVNNIRQAAIADSLRDGYHVYKDGAGRPVMEGQMLDGRRQGVWTSYLPSGRVQSRNVFENGVLDGITTVFHENGVLYYSGNQRKGKPFGEWKFYDNKGLLAKTVVYDTTGALINDRKVGAASK